MIWKDLHSTGSFMTRPAHLAVVYSLCALVLCGNLHAQTLFSSGSATARPAASIADNSAAAIESLEEEISSEIERVNALTAELESRSQALRALKRKIDALKAPSIGPSMSDVPSSSQASRNDVAATPGPPRFDFYGDTIVRLATLHQHYDLCTACPDRTIGRFRVRFGAEGRLVPGLRAIIGLGTGELDDPNSVYQTLGSNWGRKVTTWDRVYVTYRPTGAPWMELMAGKFPYPWVRSSMTFDVDFYPEGASERLSFERSGSNRFKNFSVQGLQFVVNEQANGPDMLIVGGQVSGTVQVADAIRTRALFGAMDVKRPELILRTQMDGTNVGVRNTNAIVIRGGQAFYASGFRYVNVIVENAIRTPWVSLPLTVTGEYQKNLDAVSSRDAGSSLRMDLGRLQRQGDWGLSWHLFRVEQDAIVSALGESDWRAPSNVVQHRLGAIYTWQDHLQTLFTWYRGRTLDSSVPGALLAPGLGPGQRDPWVNRLYFDVLYRF